MFILFTKEDFIFDSFTYFGDNSKVDNKTVFFVFKVHQAPNLGWKKKEFWSNNMLIGSRGIGRFIRFNSLIARLIS